MNSLNLASNFENCQAMLTYIQSFCNSIHFHRWKKKKRVSKEFGLLPTVIDEIFRMKSSEFSKWIHFGSNSWKVIRMWKEYLFTFKNLKAKEKAHPLSAIMFKSVNNNIFVFFRWNHLWKHWYYRKKAPRCSTHFSRD